MIYAHFFMQGVAGVCWIYDYRVLYGYGAGRNVTHRRD